MEVIKIDMMVVLIILILFLGFILGFKDNSRYIFNQNRFPLTGFDKYYNSVRNSLIKKQIRQTKDLKVKGELERALRIKRISFGLIFLGFLLIIVIAIMHSHDS